MLASLFLTFAHESTLLPWAWLAGSGFALSLHAMWLTIFPSFLVARFQQFESYYIYLDHQLIWRVDDLPLPCMAGHSCLLWSMLYFLLAPSPRLILPVIFVVLDPPFLLSCFIQPTRRPILFTPLLHLPGGFHTRAPSYSRLAFS
jgi:hypothetical protein